MIGNIVGPEDGFFAANTPFFDTLREYARLAEVMEIIIYAFRVLISVHVSGGKSLFESEGEVAVGFIAAAVTSTSHSFARIAVPGTR